MKNEIKIAKDLVVTRHLNGDKKVDWANQNQKKWYPWMRVIKDSDSPSGFRLSFNVSLCDLGSSGLGARLHLLSPDDVKFHHEHFRKLQEDIFFEPKK